MLLYLIIKTHLLNMYVYQTLRGWPRGEGLRSRIPTHVKCYLLLGANHSSKARDSISNALCGAEY